MALVGGWGMGGWGMASGVTQMLTGPNSDQPAM